MVWAADMGMGAEPGTMGLGLAGFVLIWTLMMAAMMLPAIVAARVTLYARTVRDNRRARLAAFGAGYVLAWALTGFVAFALASVFDTLAEDRPAVAQAVAVAAFAVCGLYQLTPMKQLVPPTLPQPDSGISSSTRLQGPDPRSARRPAPRTGVRRLLLDADGRARGGRCDEHPRRWSELRS